MQRSAGAQMRLVVELDDVQRKLEQLQPLRRALEETIAACPGRGALRACSIMEALAAVAAGVRPRNRPQEMA